MIKFASRHKAWAVSAALVTLIALPVSACSSSKNSSTSGGATSSSSTSALSGTITVLAAASLTEAFTTIGKQFEAAHPGTKVKFSFAASSALAQQINSGAPADVFASAAPKNMDQVTSKGNAQSPRNFVSNSMEIAVPPSNPANVTSLQDLAKSSVKVALCQPQVPCGATAQEVFKNAGITVKPVTLEPDVKSTLAKVELNAVDAGVVYVTDVMAAGSKVKPVPIAANVNASTEYPIATLTHAPNPTGAQAFVAYVVSPDGMSVLKAQGFAAP
jgi:molybdate transport system substrate-binding protein